MRKLLLSCLLALSASAFAYEGPAVVIAPNVGAHHGGRHHCRVSDGRGHVWAVHGRHACRRAKEQCRVSRGHRHGGRCFVVR